jgi:hypothetical protein
VTGRVGNCRNQNRQLSRMETAKGHYCGGLLAVRNLGILRRTVLARGPTLDRDRCDTGSLVFVNESDTVASCLANERIKNCHHEENRSTANAHEYNRSDHVKHDVWGVVLHFMRATLLGGFLLPNERQSLRVSLTKKVPLAFLISVSYPAQVRLRAAGDRGSEELLTTYSTVRLCCFEEPPKDPASRLGRD